MSKQLCIFLFIIIFASNAFSKAEINFSVDSNYAVLGEAYKVLIEVSGVNKMPVLSFTNRYSDIIKKEYLGIKFNRIVKKNKIKRVSRYQFLYTLVPRKTGTLWIKKIKAISEGEIIRGNSFKFYVRTKPAKRPDIFMLVDQSKTEAYIGEGIDINYYLYYDVNITSVTTDKFPKIDKFFKRFYMTDSKVERVKYKNKIYNRSLRYSARLYPEKPGNLTVGSLELTVKYFKRRGQFGQTFRNLSTKKIKSKRVKILSLPLPVKTRPNNFLGLVGKHQVAISRVENQYKANTPIEFKVTIQGPGLLENMKEINIYDHKLIEKFDVTYDFLEVDKQTGKKTFNYLMIGKDQLHIPERLIRFSYFDPISETYKNNKLLIPEIEVINSNLRDNTKKNNLPVDKKNLDKHIYLLAPKFQFNDFRSNIFNLLNIFITVLIFLLLIIYYRPTGGSKRVEHFKQNYKKIKKQGLNFNLLYQTLYLIGDPCGNKLVTDVINESNMNQGAKVYFKRLIQELAEKTYSESKNSLAYLVNKSAFNELLKEIKRIEYENNK